MDNKSCVAIICHKNKILLFHRDNKPDISNPNKWQLPGGGHENGESEWITVARELSEEVTHIPHNLSYLGWRIRRNGIVQHFFISFVDDKEKMLFKLGEDEGQAIEFFSIEEMLELDLVLYFRRFVVNNKKTLKHVLETKNIPQPQDLGLKR